MKKIGISFKDSEIDLYEFVKGKLSPSIYIKELIQKDMENKESNNKKSLEFDF